MPGGRRIEGDMTNIGEQAKPPFAVLPDPSALFSARAARFRVLASGHQLAPYLEFLGQVTTAQHDIIATLPDAILPPADGMAQALQHGMPPLALAQDEPDAAMLAAVEQLAARLEAAPLAQGTLAVVAALRGDLLVRGPELVAAVLRDAMPADDMARHVLVLAGLQVHFTRLAAKLDAGALKPVANAVCPSCGCPPMVSTIVGWPRAYKTRYCTCGRCGTMWNVIRATCVLCGTPEGVSFRGIEDAPDTVKAETCEKCRGYVKVVYQVKDAALDSLCDDVATVGLDILLAEEGWKRGGQNPFLLGY